MSGVRMGCAMVAGCMSLMVAGPGTAQAQEVVPEAEAVAVIQVLFDAIRASDSATVRSLWAEGVEKFGSSYTSPTDGPTVAFTDMDGFLSGVGGAEPGSWDEQFIVRDVIVDDNLVTLVTPYEFYFNGNFSHCGVNVFAIGQMASGWKIVSLIDTRRRAGCEGWLDE